MANENTIADIAGMMNRRFRSEDEIERDQRMKKLVEDNEMANALGITIARLWEIRKYAANLRSKYPWMSPSRIQRKTAEYFKVKFTK
jgi:hypothetical protein